MTLNFVFPDTNEKFLLTLENGVLNHTANKQAENPDTKITLNRATLNDIVLKNITLEQALKEDQVKIEGNQEKLKELLGLLDNFNFWFNIVTP